MKYILSLCLLFLFSSFRPWDSDIYSQPLKDIDGNTIDLAAYRGKKILLIVLPVAADSNVITASGLSALAVKYSDLLHIICVPAEEWGYSPEAKEQLKTSYSGLAANIILSEGMKVKKASGAEQSSLFQWLTDKNKNSLSDREVGGVGDKFFVDEEGRLYGVMGKNLQLDNPVIDRIITKTRSTPQ